MKILSVVALLVAPAFTINLKERLAAQANSMQHYSDTPAEQVENLEDLPYIALGDHDYQVLGDDEPCHHV